MRDIPRSKQAACASERDPPKLRGSVGSGFGSGFVFPCISSILENMSKAFEFCIPSRGTKAPHTPDWLHEIKYDGYRLRLERDGDRVRLFTRNGYDWTKRYPWIAEAALKNRQNQFVIDGEAVILGVDGRSDFDALHSGKHNDQVQLYAFDMLAGDGDDMRQLPLSMRKANLARLLARRTEGIFIGPFEQGEIGPDLFRAGIGIEAPRPTVSRRAVAILGEDQ